MRLQIVNMRKQYDVTIVKIVDGDTVDVDIELGFDICLRNQRIRINGIDSPESRTLDPVEKVFGLLAKNKVKEILTNSEYSAKLIVSDVPDKFGRILGDFIDKDGKKLSEILINDGYCATYHGGNKDEVKEQHLANRQKLIDKGLAIMDLNDT
jgi:micrococcal nuclease